MYKILLVDDDADDRLLFAEALQELSIECSLETACDGLDALDMLSQMDQLPSIVFMDVNMPGITGIKCIEIMRQDLRYNHLPIIVMSTSSDQDIITMAYLAGANYFIQKSSGFEGLKNSIKGIVSIDWTDDWLQAQRDSFVFRFN